MSPRGTSRVWPSAVAVFVVALAVRLAHVLALRDSPYFARPVLDAETYYWAARALAAGEGWAERVFPDTAVLLARVAIAAGCGPEAEGFAARAVALDGGSDLARRLMAEAATLRASPAGSPAGGCPDRVFVAPLTLPS